jgi:Fe-S-cluster containining protein
LVINHYSTFDLCRNKLTVNTPVAGDTVLETRINYVDHNKVRDAAREIAIMLVREYERELFFNVCGRCGNCCKTFTVPVNAHEIMRITRFLNMSSDDEFREKFTIPACTWNEKDGIIKRVNNQCIFFEKISAEKYGCAIYPVRPLFCSAFIPCTELCKKAPEKLVCYLETIKLHSDSVKVTTVFERIIDKRIGNPAIQEVVRDLIQKLSKIDEKPVDKLEHISTEALRILDELVREFFSLGKSGEFLARVQGMEEVIHDLECLTSPSTKDPEIIGELKRKFGHIRDLMAGRVPPRQCERASAGVPFERIAFDESPIKAIRFLQEHFSVIGYVNARVFHKLVHYRDNEEILRIIRELLHAIMTLDDPVLHDALSHREPECFMCGECCRHNPVEISPYDIEKIGEFFALTEEEVWEKFLEKGRFSWNSKNAIFKRVVNEREQRDCIFLRKKFEGIYCCSIYEVRPQICREYSTTSKLCRQTSLIKKSPAHMSTIISIDIIGDVIYLITHHTHATSSPPVAIPMKGNEKLSHICRAIKRKVLDIAADAIVSTKGP